METKIFDYGMNGEGVAKIDGKIVLINNALINEVADIDIVEDNKNYCIGKLSKIISQSSQRQNPPCPYFSECGGCQLQHMTYSEQLKFKTLNIKKTIKKICNLEVAVKDCVPCSSCYNYRNKMSFSINNEKCGLLKPNSNEIVEITQCPLATDNINKVLSLFKEFQKEFKLQDIKNLVVRDINKQLLVGVVTKKHINLIPFYNHLTREFKQIGLYEIINTRKDSVVLSGKVNHIAGIKEIEINNFDLTYSVDLLGFHQTNIEIQNKLYEKVLEFIDEKSIVLNGFSGQGLLSAIISKKAKQVIGIEINTSSHLSAEQLKKINNITNLKNICGDFFKEVLKIKNQANTVILDPTKKGCGKQAMQSIIGVKNIIYISCDMITLKRDLE
ncbi:MAG: 23S rRNA (uracil(1939)-C(5))-methyltransferase RlmD, partial [Clostridia bacterium]|nr:23S rRNA (uracil(1939)-C(5))-methyltransferase RlmD [Clostridia bacterium]